MSRFRLATLRRALPQVVLAVASAALTVVAMHFFAPGQLTAAPSQQGDIRATSFTLVDSQGTILGRLRRSTANPSNGGVLELNDRNGETNVQLRGDATVGVVDGNGTPRAYVGQRPDGSYGVAVQDANGNVTYTAP